MVQKVSSMVENQSVKSNINNNFLIISTDIWDFEFSRLSNLGYYVYDSVTIKDRDLDVINSEVKKSIMRQYICKYGITISL